MAGSWEFNINEFEECFANSLTYGEQGDCWPRKTILFYQINDGEWNRSDNTFLGKHAEQNMLESILPACFRNGNNKLVIYSSYSPCSVCAGSLLAFKDQFNHIGDVDIEIRFGTFYKTPEYLNGGENRNIQGLVKLVKNQFTLNVFKCRDDWEQFLKDIEIPAEQQQNYLDLLSYERGRREEVDQQMLQAIKDRADRELEQEA